MGKFAALRAKAPLAERLFFAALKRCATQELQAVLEFHISQQKRKAWHRAFIAALILTSGCFASLFLQAQNLAGGQAAAAPGPKADAIYIHANVYTGVPANSQFSSIDREEAIAVRGDRILAVGKNTDIQRFKGPQTQVVDLSGHF